MGVYIKVEAIPIAGFDFGFNFLGLYFDFSHSFSSGIYKVCSTNGVCLFTADSLEKASSWIEENGYILINVPGESR